MEKRQKYQSHTLFIIGLLMASIFVYKFSIQTRDKSSPVTANSKMAENILGEKINWLASIFAYLENKKPNHWGYYIKGVKTRLNSRERVLALTLDACGSQGDGYDKKLIDFLIREKIPATIFLSNRWLEKNSLAFRNLATNNFFEIANHGYNHLPCSANGKKAFGIPGTGKIREIIEEIERNSLVLFNFNRKRPLYYRSGTAHYDEICLEIAQKLGYQTIGFSVNADGGAQYSKEKVKRIVSAAKPGSIILLHMNHPEKMSSLGFMEAYPFLKKNNYRFVGLREFDLL